MITDNGQPFDEHYLIETPKYSKMKKLIMLSTIAASFLMATNTVQSQVIGSIDQDGNHAISVTHQEAMNILEEVSHFTEPQPFQPTEITLTTMPQGEICLTGYIRNPVGHIIRGFRIMCIQDDANNLIVKPGSKVERINGHQF